MEKLIQFSVFLINRPGILSQVFRDLAKGKVNITSISMMDTTEHGVLRLVVDDPAGARAVFKQVGVPVSEAEVLAVTLSNRPGAAADLCERLAAKHVNIAYMYCTSGAKGGKTLVVFKVPDIKKAIKVLDEAKTNNRDMRIKLRRPTATRR